MNEDIRQKIKDLGLYQCQVARQMGIFEHAFHRMLRKELSEEKRTEIMNAIKALTKEGVIKIEA